MGKIVMPKNSALLNEIEAVLKIYYEANDWIPNDEYKRKLKALIGDDQYSSSYTKKAQITSYFGFTVWEDIHNPQSMRKITPSGIKMYEAILENNTEAIQDVLMNALETVKFGRDNYGCPDSSSDVEPPSLFVRAILDLGYLTYREFAFLLWKLEDIGANYTDALAELRGLRSRGAVDFGEEANKNADCKPIMILVRWGFLSEDIEDSSGGKHIVIAPAVLRKYATRLRNLKIYNIDMNISDPRRVNENSDIKQTIKGIYGRREFNYVEVAPLYNSFSALFGKEAIERLDGEALLNHLFGKKEHQSLVYYLEHVNEYDYFGKIGGWRTIYTLYEKDGVWKYCKTAKNVKDISIVEAIEIARKYRDCFVSFFDYLDAQIADGAFEDMSGYADLYPKAKEYLGVLYNKNWVWKYLHMLYPQLFITVYSEKWVNKMFRVIHVVPEKNYVLQCGQLSLLAKELDIENVYLFHILTKIDDVDINEGDDGDQEIADEIVEETIDYDNAPRITGGENIILYGVPGAGKSWTIKNEYCSDDDCMERLVFHPDYTYSDFVGQIMPKIDEKGGVTYEFAPGPFTELVRKAYRNPEKMYYLVIEEVNRGNAPAIFGDIFQLLDRQHPYIDGIENPKYGASEYAITNADIARVVYGDASHGVSIPSNMSILCTMNTSDQNVFTLDTAFQRRWSMRLISNEFGDAEGEQEFAATKILDTDVTWQKFFTEVNTLILNKNIRMTSSEDKRLGTHFVTQDDLRFDDYDGEDAELRKKSNRQNRRFAEKVLKYLWDDAFKFNKDEIFDLSKVNSLEKVIKDFVSAKGNERFKKIFKEGIANLLIPRE